MSYGRFERRMRHLANAGGPKKLAYAKEKQLVYEMHKRNWSEETLVDNWRGKGAEVVVVREVSDEDNGVVATVGKPATMQEPVKIGKRVIYRNNIVEFSYLGWLSCKVRTTCRTRSEGLFAKSEPPFKTRSETFISDLIFQGI